MSIASFRAMLFRTFTGSSFVWTMKVGGVCGVTFSSAEYSARSLSSAFLPSRLSREPVWAQSDFRVTTG